MGWPGFGETPHDPNVNGVEGLVNRVLGHLDEPSVLVAQSMGGVVALLAALARPAAVTHLVLTATSGGLDMRGLGAHDWRAEFERANPHLPSWFAEWRMDLSPSLPSVQTPTLLLWGDNDPISPVAVGQRLAALLPHAHLHVLPGGTHDVGLERASEVATLVDAHVGAGGKAVVAS